MANEQGPRWRFEPTGHFRGLVRDGRTVFGRTINGGHLWPSIDLQREILTALNNHEQLMVALGKIAKGYRLDDADIAHEAITTAEAKA